MSRRDLRRRIEANQLRSARSSFNLNPAMTVDTADHETLGPIIMLHFGEPVQHVAFNEGSDVLDRLIEVLSRARSTAVEIAD